MNKKRNKFWNVLFLIFLVSTMFFVVGCTSTKTNVLFADPGVDNNTYYHRVDGLPGSVVSLDLNDTGGVSGVSYLRVNW